MADPSARQRTARRRIAARVAAGATAAFALMTWPVLAASETKTVVYSCTALGGGQGTYPVSVTLLGPDNPAVGGNVQITWRMAPATAAEGQTPMLAPTSIASDDVVVAEGVMEVTGTPVASGSPSPSPSASATPTPTPTPTVTPTPTPPDVDANPPGGTDTAPSPDESEPSKESLAAAGGRTLSPSATVTAGTPVAAQATLSPIPDLVVTLAPTAAGVIGVTAGDFTLRLLPSGTGTGAALYTCTLPATAAGASLALTVAASPSPSTSPSPSDTGDADDTTPTPTPTETTTATETATATATVTHTATARATTTVSHTVTAQVGRTPIGGAQTGAGGDAGPDARVVVLTGLLLMAASAAGGLLLRRFGPRPRPYGGR